MDMIAWSFFLVSVWVCWPMWQNYCKSNEHTPGEIKKKNDGASLYACCGCGPQSYCTEDSNSIHSLVFKFQSSLPQKYPLASRSVLHISGGCFVWMFKKIILRPKLSLLLALTDRLFIAGALMTAVALSGGDESECAASQRAARRRRLHGKRVCTTEDTSKQEWGYERAK